MTVSRTVLTTHKGLFAKLELCEKVDLSKGYRNPQRKLGVALYLPRT